MKTNQIVATAKKVGNNVATKYAALGTALAVPLAARAEGEVWADAVTELTGLKVGVIAVGGLILGLAITAVGFFVIKRLVNRA